MICRAGQTCLVRLEFWLGIKETSSTTYLLHESSCVKDVYSDIEERYQLKPDSFRLYLQLASGEKMIDISEMKEKTVSKIGLDFSLEQEPSEITLIVSELNAFRGAQKRFVDRGLFKCNYTIDRRLQSSVSGEDNVNSKSPIKSETNYVGLVNQAMTCYLNSLLQALYMTPEFRNALYNWEYIHVPEKDETSSIPYQLQKLFLNLQTSTKSAVETTSLTKSFGWDSTEAWHQHDIQELCRVMFDALEQKFKNTEQADLINRLYEGKMIDYVKCLECGTEKSREDTFLDIPLPVRPFGSTVAYNSVEEALRAFVQYETLEGNNQYHCDNCNKKCDAHKGLKFTKFPYLLTLHLKRFDFDFKTLHRIKLNDKVTFPDTLNLNTFITSTTNQESPAGEEDIGLGVNLKCDDSSTTDSGNLDDDCPPCENSLSNSNHSTNHDQYDDEGIDLCNGPSTSNCTLDNHENEKNRANCSAKGPYQYELFSIMIHSGSASGGHYYAYIKDFRTQDWLCFNDQSVTQITDEDIQKTYGGGRSRVYYSGAYSSSTNAYMLMYRQIDRARNVLPMQTEDFPEHIKELLKKMKESEDNDKKFLVFNDKNYRDRSIATFKLKVYCRQAAHGSRCIKIYPLPNATWAEVTEDVYKKFGLEGVVSLDQCRLVSYDHSSGLIIRSFDDKPDQIFPTVWRNQALLEIRRKDEKFETYLPGGLVTKVYVIDIPREELIGEPINVRALFSQTVKEYKQMLGKIINMDPKDMKLILRKETTGWTINVEKLPKEMNPMLLNIPEDLTIVASDDIQLQHAGFYNAVKVFVSTMFDIDSSKPFHESMLYEIIEDLDNVISLQIQLPDTCKENLEETIRSLEDKYKDNKKALVSSLSKLSTDDSQQEIGPQCNENPKVAKNNDEASARNISPQVEESEDWNTPEQSNSEDSSLSDSDKTLVGDAPEDDDIQITFLGVRTTYNTTVKLLNQMGLKNSEFDGISAYYFNVTGSDSSKRLLNIMVDKRMKLSTLKKNLEPYVGVPSEFFIIFRESVSLINFDSEESECNCLSEPLSFEDGERLTVQLGRALRAGEFKVKLYHFLIDATEPLPFLCEWIVSKDMTVGQAKKEILAEIKKKFDIDIPYERCRLRLKHFRMVSKVFLNEQKFEDVPFGSRLEMVIQELPDEEPVTDSNQVVLFVRRWSPAKMQVGPFQEIVMDETTVEELKEKLSWLSDIPEEFIDVVKVKGLFPSDMPVLRIQNELDWKKNMQDFPIVDGNIFLYRDNRENEKHLTPEEVTEITMKETTRIVPHSFPSSYSSSTRKERALRIHLDAK